MVLCNFCTDVPWIPDPISRIPRPYPSANGNYLHHGKTPVEGRQPDDFQLRAQLKLEFQQGKISNNKPDVVTEFSKIYIVNLDLVYNELEHLKLVNI